MKIHWPEINIPDGFNDAESYLRHLVYQGAKERFVYDENDSNAENLREERIGFIEHELEALKGYEPYIIMSYDLVSFCKAKGIIVSPGYGDAINSIVNYCLGITTTEPDSYFHFESFFLRGTDLYPKLNIQVDKTRKDEILEYLKYTYGEHHVLRAGVGHRKGHERVPVYDVHACGICIFDRPYYEIIETTDITEKESGKRTTVPKLTMEELESLGYININILGMNCLTPTTQTLQLIKQNKGEMIDFDHIPDDDPATMDFLASGNEDIDKIWNCEGIAKDFASVKPTYMQELCAINSLWTLNLYDDIDYYIYLVQNDKYDDRFELFEEIFSEMSRGLILYREQILCVLFIMSGLSIAECERIRRQMSTSDNLSAKNTFLDGVKSCGGYDVDEAERIWDYFMEVHGKVVSMAHYLSLTVLWYRISWLRVHYPEEFSLCYIKGQSGGQSPVTRSRTEMLQVNVTNEVRGLMAEGREIIDNNSKNMPYNRKVVMKRWDWIKFLGIELDSVGVEVMKDGFPWKDVDACLGNEVGPPIEGMTTCPECGCELRWIHFCSPSVTWKHECGREGSLAICENCHKQVYFKCELMN